MSTSEDQPVDTYTDLTARLAAADLGWSHEHGDPPANPDYIKRLAFQVMAFKPPLIAGVYVDDEMLDDMRDRLHGDNCGCGEWDSHSQEYVERMDETIHAVLYPLRHPVRPVSQGTEDSPEVVCICGSMRFRDLMLKVAADETAAGRIVLMPFAVVAPVDQGSDFKRMLDTLHRRKIDLSGRVIVVVDESEYYGESTRGEIEYASKTGKVVSFQTVERTAADSDYWEQIARALVPGGDQSTFGRVLDVIAPLVEQLRQAQAAYNRMAGHAVDRAAERDRYYLAWQSAARGRMRARIERDTLGECMACVWCDDTGIAPEERFGRDDDGAPMMDGDQPCPKGCPVRRDIAYLLSEEKEAEQLRAALVLATAEAEDARDGGLDLAQELAEVRESRDQYHKNWDAAVAANMTALDTIGGLRADLETRTCERDYARAELDAVGRAIEGYLGVEYGTPVESARVLVERCADAESALDGLRATAVVLPEDWRQMLADGDYPEQVVDLIESWRAAPVLPVTPDEHVREHDDAASTRDEVVEAWADTWDGVDRTPEWVRVVEPCPVPDCTIPQVHGHEGYGLRFTPAAQPAHPRPPLDPLPNSLNERLHIRRSGARLGPMDPSDVVKPCVRCGCPQGAHHKLHCEGRLGDCICHGGFEDSPDYVLTALDKVGLAENAEWDAEHRAGASPGTGTEAGE